MHTHTHRHAQTQAHRCAQPHTLSHAHSRAPLWPHTLPPTHTCTYTHSCLLTLPVFSQHFMGTCRNWVITVNRLNTPDPMGMYTRRKPHIREEMEQGTKSILIQSTTRVSYEETQDSI